jgi:hypothetical protein
MRRSHFLFRDVPVDAWVDRYEKGHQNPINRVFHTFGIPMIAVSIPLFLILSWFEDFGKFRCRCLRPVGFAKCLDTSSKVSHPNSSKTGGFSWSDFVGGSRVLRGS